MITDQSEDMLFDAVQSRVGSVDIVAQAWATDTWTVDRIGRSGRPVRIGMLRRDGDTRWVISQIGSRPLKRMGIPVTAETIGTYPSAREAVTALDEATFTSLGYT